MKLEEMSAVEILASKKIERLYGWPLLTAMAENKNDLHERTYDGKSLRTACKRLMEELTEVSQVHIYNFFGIIGQELPYSVSELTEIYSLLYEWGHFTEENFKDAWRTRITFEDLINPFDVWKVLSSAMASSRTIPQ